MSNPLKQKGSLPHKTDELKRLLIVWIPQKGKLTLDEEGSDLIDCDMWITFEDGTYKNISFG